MGGEGDFVSTLNSGGVPIQMSGNNKSLLLSLSLSLSLSFLLSSLTLYPLCLYFSPPSLCSSFHTSLSLLLPPSLSPSDEFQRYGATDNMSLSSHTAATPRVVDEEGEDVADFPMHKVSLWPAISASGCGYIHI